MLFPTATIFLLSLIGFCAFGVIDSAAFVRFAKGRSIISLLGAASLILAFTLASNEGQPLGIPDWLEFPGWVLSLLGGCLLIYSVFIEIPLTIRRRQSNLSGDSRLTLVQTGTYALCRHPGFWWLLLFLCGQVLVIRRSEMLRLAVMWMALDFLLVFVQDRILFPARFSGYKNYRYLTPFLIPSRQSIRTVFQSNGDAR